MHSSPARSGNLPGQDRTSSSGHRQQRRARLKSYWLSFIRADAGAGHRSLAKRCVTHFPNTVTSMASP
jgi:hypothetical protein